MADVEKIIVGSNAYDICDSYSRSFMGGMRKPLKGMKTLLLGNSYNRGVGGDSSSFTYTRSDGTTTTYGKGWGYYFQQDSECDATIICQSGGDFAKAGNANAFYPSMTYAQLIDAFAETLTEDEKNEYKYIIVGGGFNDHDVSAGTITTAMSTFCEKCRTYFPNADVWIFPLWCDRAFNGATEEHAFNVWSNYAARLHCGTNSNTFSWFYGRSDLACETESLAGRMHLNDTGYRICAHNMYACMLGWDGDWNPYMGKGWTAADGMSDYSYNGNTISFRYYRKSGYVHFNGGLTFSSTAKPQTSIGSIGSEFRPARNSYIPVEIFTMSSTSTRYVGICEVNTSGNMKLIAMNDTQPDTGTIFFSGGYIYGM